MNYSIKPEEHELREARQVIDAALESSKHVLDKEESLNIHLGHGGKTEVGSFGVFGEALDSENGRIYFNTSGNNWKQNLNDLTIDIYGQTWFYEKQESLEFIWQQFLAAITGLLLIDQVSEGREPDYKGLKEEWREKKENLSEQISLEYQESFSWQLKLLLGRKLVEDRSLEDFPELKRSDVIDTGDKVFL